MSSSTPNGEHPMGLGLLLTPQDPTSQAAREAAVEGEVVQGVQLEDQTEVLVDKAQPFGHDLPEVEGDVVQLGMRAGIRRWYPAST